MRIFSWNVNGLRAAIRKGDFLKFIEDFQPDILCLQETKAKRGQAEYDLPDYQEFWQSAKRPGYSGTAIFTKSTPLSMPDPILPIKTSLDQYGDVQEEGRVSVAEYPKFFLVNVYTPNSKRDLTRLDLRFKIWDPAFLKFLKQLEKQKPVITCGDFNAAHTAIDLARPKDNEKNAGFTIEERQGITNIIDAGFIDTFRHLHPKTERYSWWAYFSNARARNIGWRIDYFFISRKLLPHLKSADIHTEVFGSDHCPISVELDI